MNPVLNLHNNLVQELNAIAPKRLDDNLWFDFGAEDRLILRPRPLGFLACLWELLARFFTSKLSRLENKFVWITAEVEAYLAQENDQGRLGLFLNTHTESLNEIFRCAMKMQQAGRISQEAVDEMEQKALVRSYVLMPRDETARRGEGEDPYLHLARLHLTNESTAQVEFHFPENYRLQNVNLETGVHHLQDVPVLGEMLEISALIQKIHPVGKLDSGIYRASFLPGGKWENVKVEEASDIQISFCNRTAGAMTVQALIQQEDGRDTVAGKAVLGAPLQPQTESLRVKIPCKAKTDLSFITGYSPQPYSIRLGCKIGEYSVTINEDGEFVSRVVSKQILRTSESERRVLRPGESVSFPNRSPHGVWMMIKSPEFGYALRCFVLPNGEKTIAYDELRHLLSEQDNQREIPLVMTCHELAASEE